MQLRDYLHFERIKPKDFAIKCDYSVTAIRELANGRYKPGRKLIKIIERVTQGKVKEEDLK